MTFYHTSNRYGQPIWESMEIVMLIIDFAFHLFLCISIFWNWMWYYHWDFWSIKEIRMDLCDFVFRTSIWVICLKSGSMSTNLRNTIICLFHLFLSRVLDTCVSHGSLSYALSVHRSNRSMHNMRSKSTSFKCFLSFFTLSSLDSFYSRHRLHQKGIQLTSASARCSFLLHFFFFSPTVECYSRSASSCVRCYCTFTIWIAILSFFPTFGCMHMSI